MVHPKLSVKRPNGTQYCIRGVWCEHPVETVSYITRFDHDCFFINVKNSNHGLASWNFEPLKVCYIKCVYICYSCYILLMMMLVVVVVVTWWLWWWRWYWRWRWWWRWRWRWRSGSHEDFVARSRYLRQGYVITSRSLQWDVITYPCLRYLILATKSSHVTWFMGHLVQIDDNARPEHCLRS